MQRRKFVIGMGALASGAAAAVGTGAFSTVEAERDMTVEVASDAQAYLAFDTDLGNSPDNNYEYSEVSDGELTISFDENDAGGEGVNPNAVTHFDDVFSINNQGTEDVEIWFTLDEALEDYVDVYPIAGNHYRETSLVGEENAFSASWATGVGSSCRIGITIDLSDATDVNAEDVLDGSITVHADAV